MKKISLDVDTRTVSVPFGALDNQIYTSLLAMWKAFTKENSDLLKGHCFPMTFEVDHLEPKIVYKMINQWKLKYV